MKCEFCEKEVKKGYMENLETLNLIFYLCGDCMLKIEDMVEEFIKETKTPNQPKKRSYIQQDIIGKD